MTNRVLVIGSGGREHALCWKLAQSDQVAQIYCAPGNGGTAYEAKTQNVPIPVQDFSALLAFSQKQQIDLVVVGPDNPLADGIVDVFQKAGLRIFGPTQAAARLESSKVFSKQFMQQAQLPTAQFGVFNAFEAAFGFCQQNPWARVIKVDGLALGKGVFVCDSLQDCEDALKIIFDDHRFGAAGQQVVIEEKLSGPEISLITLFDGKTILPLASSQDYKRRFESQTGPNTGGMGAYSPVLIDDDTTEQIHASVLAPLQSALKNSGLDFHGVLYIGLMLHQGKPYILEFNARFGDPETQCLLPRLQADLWPVLNACIDGTLSDITLTWNADACTCVVACADTYPDKGSSGVPIEIGTIPEGTLVLHAGTTMQNGHLVTQGGRVLNIVSLGKTPEEAAQKSYRALQSIHFDGMAYRDDIAREVSACLSR